MSAHAPTELIDAVLDRHPEVRLAVLFGSLADGTARPESDLDLAVAGDAPLDAAKRTALIEDLAAASGRPVDLVDLHTCGVTVRAQALTRGRTLRNADPRLRAELIKRVLFDEADFVPYRRRILKARRSAWTRG
jgi:predicted nucleotidyltransferase